MRRDYNVADVWTEDSPNLPADPLVICECSAGCGKLIFWLRSQTKQLNNRPMFCGECAFKTWHAAPRRRLRVSG